ncbi:MAG: TolC family protein [Planctomycetota bacterium]
MLLSVVGCATTPTGPWAAKDRPADHVIADASPLRRVDESVPTDHEPAVVEEDSTASVEPVAVAEVDTQAETPESIVLTAAEDFEPPQISTPVEYGESDSSAAPPADFDPADTTTSRFGPTDFAALPFGMALTLRDVEVSVLSERFPPLVEAINKRTIAYGVQLAASGEFDTKLTFDSENQVLDFYPNYRQSAALKQPVYEGGEVFGGYRVGRGFFEPWLQDLQTDDGGEFKVGFIKPLWRDVDIDERRAALWRAGFERQAVEFEVALDRIGFLFDGSIAYWDWVTAGRNLQIAEDLLQIARTRDERLRTRVEVGQDAENKLIDNRRLIVSREQKLIAAEQKFAESSVKLSIFLRDNTGVPILPDKGRLPQIPPQDAWTGAPPDELAIADALARRPETALFNATRRAFEVDLNQARNTFLPNLDASLVASQDIGSPTSSLADKSPFSFEAFLFFETPLQRRKALGKIRAVEGKLAQLSAKLQFARDKITAEVRAALVALEAAAEQIVFAIENRDLAAELAEIERLNEDEGASDLINVNIRELQAAEAALSVNEAIRDYRIAEAALRAAVGLQSVADPLPTGVPIAPLPIPVLPE